MCVCCSVMELDTPNGVYGKAYRMGTSACGKIHLFAFLFRVLDCLTWKIMLFSFVFLNIDYCRCEISSFQFMYHCFKVDSKYHEFGYDLCVKCGDKKKKHVHMDNYNNDKTGVKKHNNQFQQVLFRKLKTMAKANFEQLRDKLRKKLDAMTPKPSFKQMIKFEQSKKDKEEQFGSQDVNLRQDNPDYLEFPNTLEEKKLKTLEKFELTDFYDSTVYLADLLVVSHAINEKFHKAMQTEILAKDFNVQYQRGPIKGVGRCRNKVEIEYTGKPYPYSSQILDFVRCSCVYDNR